MSDPLSCETTCETMVENPTDLYSLFPGVVRAASLVASEIPEEEPGVRESVLKRITYALEREYDATALEIQRLGQLADPDSCPSELLSLFGVLVSCPGLGLLSTIKQRLLLRSMMLIWRAKGTRSSWRCLLHLFGKSAYLSWELWKHEIYETWDYSPYFDYTHQIKAARVDFTLPADPYSRLLGSQVDEWREVIESVRPIHVLPRRDVILVEVSDTLATLSESIEYSLSEVLEEQNEYTPDGDVTLVQTCVHWCQSACQTVSEYACYGSCETVCESVCELACQTYSDMGCAVSCQMACQIECQVTCEVGCEIACETGCEVSCETGCEISCEIGCEVSCEIGCEVSCEIGCEVSCEIGGEVCMADKPTATVSGSSLGANGDYAFSEFGDLGYVYYWLLYCGDWMLWIFYCCETGTWCSSLEGPGGTYGDTGGACPCLEGYALIGTLACVGGNIQGTYTLDNDNPPPAESVTVVVS